MQTENAIQIEGLCKNYDSFSLKDVDMVLPGGYIMGLIGENGAGKSTIIRLLLGMCRPDKGRALVLGEESTGLSLAAKEHIGVVMDECCFPEVSCGTSIKAGMGRVTVSF